jgi:hypothetical protein
LCSASADCATACPYPCITSKGRVFLLHAKKVYTRIKSVAPLIVNLGTRWM